MLFVFVVLVILVASYCSFVGGTMVLIAKITFNFYYLWGGGNLGHVTQIRRANVGFPIPWRLNIKFGLDCQCILGELGA